MASLTEIVKEILSEAMEWKDVPQSEKNEAYKLVDEHNKHIDPSIKGFYYIDVTGKYEVYYTFWRYKEVDPRFGAFIRNPIYMQNLTTDLISSVKKAISIMAPTVRLELVSDETRKNLIGKQGKDIKFKFGKYRGESMAAVYLKNPSYFAFLAKNSDPRYDNTPSNQAIKFFAEMYFEETKQKNLATSTSQHVGKEGDKYQGELEVYKIDDKTGQFGAYKSYKLKDASGNKFLAVGLEKKFPNIKVTDKIKLQGTIKKNLELLGIKFTALSHTKPA